MKIGQLDLSPFEYLIIYKDKRDDTINTWTLPEGSFQHNYAQMKKSGNVEFIGIYKQLSDSDLIDVLIR